METLDSEGIVKLDTQTVRVKASDVVALLFVDGKPRICVNPGIQRRTLRARLLDWLRRR